MSTILVTGAATGFGNLISLELAARGHTVYATMRDPSGRNLPRAAALRAASADVRGDLRPLELDVRSQYSVDVAAGIVIAEQGSLDVVVHNAACAVVGVAESFTPDEMAAVFDTNVLGAQRVNRAVLPHLRAQESGLVVWIGSTSSRGGHPPFMGPYVAAMAAGDLLAQTYAYELVRFGIETTIVAAGVFTEGTEAFVKAAGAADAETAAAYDRYDELVVGLDGRLRAIQPADADPQQVAVEVGRIVDLPGGRRPFRVVISPVDDGAGAVTEVAERARATFAQRIGIEDLLPPGHRNALPRRLRVGG